MRQPMIGIPLTADISAFHHPILRIPSEYVECVRQAGGVPLPLVPCEESQWILPYLDGLLLPGGEDTDPHFYGQEPIHALTTTDRQQDLFELQCIQQMEHLHRPILGICRGHQLLNIAHGGTVYQDLSTQRPKTLCHRQKTRNRGEAFHTVNLSQDSVLFPVFEQEQIRVNTYHHQGIDVLGEGLVATGWAADGIIECIQSTDQMQWGVQWHPELMAAEDPKQKRLFVDFITLCAQVSEKHKG